MATYEKTIIIESNKQSAVAASKTSDDSSLYDKDDTIDDGNHRWETYIPDGLPLEVGDTINLESSMINAVGGGDSVIELTGFTGETINSLKIRDNKMKISMSFYVTNAQQFNFNLPKDRHQCCYNVKKARFGGYANTYGDNFGGTPVVAPNTRENNADFYSWEKSYPYQMVEGVGTQLKVVTGVAIPYEYETQVLDFNSALFNQYLPSFATGSRRTNLPDERRFYIGKRNYTGAHYTNEVNIPVPGVAGKVYSYVVGNTPWDYLTKDIDFEVERGFVTPSSLAAKLTEQLHEREGNADDFKEEEVEAHLFSVGNISREGVDAQGNGSIGVIQTQGVSDKANIILPNAPGKPWYRAVQFRNNQGEEPVRSADPDIFNCNNDNWKAKFLQYQTSGSTYSNIDFSRIGLQYCRNQGDATYYSHIATARPEYMKAMSNLNIRMAHKPKSQGGNPNNVNFTLWTGHRTFGGAGGQPPVADTETTRQHYPPIQNGDDPGGTPIFIAGSTGPNVVLMDILPFQTQDNIFISLNKIADRQPATSIGAIQNGSKNGVRIWRPTKGDAITTNILINSETKAILEDSFRDYFIVYGKDANTVNPDDLGFRNALGIELNFGRIDDQQSNYKGSNDYDEITNQNFSNFKEVFLPSTYSSIFYQSIVADAGNPYNLTGFQYEHKVDAQLTAVNPTTLPSAPNYTTAGYNLPGVQKPSMPGSVFGTEGRWYAEYYLPEDYTAEKAWAGEIVLQNVATSRFQAQPNSYLQSIYTFDQFKEQIWGNIPTDANGKKLAFLPVCFKRQQDATVWMGTNSFREFFFAWIYKARIPPNYKPQRFPVKIETDDEYNQYIPQVLPYVGEFVGLSPSEITCDLAQIVTTQKRKQTNVYIPKIGSGAGSTLPASEVPNAGPDSYVPFVFIGATDPLIKFDDAQGRFAMSQFHTPLKEGNGTFQIPKIPTASEPNNIQAAANFRRCMISQNMMDGNIVPDPTRVNKFNEIVSKANTLINAVTGMAIDSVSIFIEDTINPTTLLLESGGRELYQNTLFNKMGFSLEQLIPFFGTSQAQFNRANYNEYLGFQDGVDVYKKYNNMVKPFTTNAFVSSTMMMGLARIMGFTDIPAGTPPSPFVPTDKMFSPVPAFNLGAIQPQFEANIQAESDELIAENLPRKLSYPYLVVRTNLIINPDYIGGRLGYEKLPAIAYITRNYSEGDYFYSFTTNWNYTVDLPYVVSSIITDIRLPDGRPAPIDDNSSVIYKINKLRTLPNVPGIITDEEKNIKREEKAKVMPPSN